MYFLQSAKAASWEKWSRWSRSSGQWAETHTGPPHHSPFIGIFLENAGFPRWPNSGFTHGAKTLGVNSRYMQHVHSCSIEKETTGSWGWGGGLSPIKCGWSHPSRRYRAHKHVRDAQTQKDQLKLEPQLKQTQTFNWIGPGDAVERAGRLEGYYKTSSHIST